MAHFLLYGGTFDPIHVGHLIACRAAREALQADRVIFIPACLSPHKQGEPPAASAEQRLEMLRLAIGNSRDFDVDARELSRPPPSYTVDTVRAIRREYANDRITLLIGSDQLAKFHAWHDVAGLMEEVGLAVLQRSSHQPIEQSMASIRQHMSPQAAERVRQALLNTPVIDISSTMIRRRVTQRLSIDYLVPPAVGAYITQAGLYL